MKTPCCLFLLSVLLFGCKAEDPDAMRHLTRDQRLVPPGTVWLRDSLYMDQTEIRNLDYVEYLHWLKKNDSLHYTAALPDSNVWVAPPYYNQPYVRYYLWHPAYRNYPVVGVSYEQAVAFCKWRSDRVNEFAVTHFTVDSKRYAKFRNVEYRLPTKKEWEYAAAAGDMGNAKGDHRWSMSPFGYEKITDKNNYPKVWVKEAAVLFGNSNADVLVPVNRGEPNKFGFYNMIGNVAEMTSDKGVSKGGSVLDQLYDCETSDSLLYAKPVWWVGFRCVCIIKNQADLK